MHTIIKKVCCYGDTHKTRTFVVLRADSPAMRMASLAGFHTIVMHYVARICGILKPDGHGSSDPRAVVDGTKKCPRASKHCRSLVWGS